MRQSEMAFDFISFPLAKRENGQLRWAGLACAPANSVLLPSRASACIA
jgi:hypothetical protein